MEMWRRSSEYFGMNEEDPRLLSGEFFGHNSVIAPIPMI